MATADFVAPWSLNYTIRTQYQGEDIVPVERKPAASIIDDLAAMYEGKKQIPRQETVSIPVSTTTVTASGLSGRGPMESILEKARNTWTSAPLKVPVSLIEQNTTYLPRRSVTKPKARAKRT